MGDKKKIGGSDIPPLIVDGSDFGWRRKPRRSLLLEAGCGENHRLVGGRESESHVGFEASAAKPNIRLNGWVIDQSNYQLLEFGD